MLSKCTVKGTLPLEKQAHAILNANSNPYKVLYWQLGLSIRGVSVVMGQPVWSCEQSLCILIDIVGQCVSCYMKLPWLLVFFWSLVRLMGYACMCFLFWHTWLCRDCLKVLVARYMHYCKDKVNLNLKKPLVIFSIEGFLQFIIPMKYKLIIHRTGHKNFLTQEYFLSVIFNISKDKNVKRRS